MTQVFLLLSKISVPVSFFADTVVEHCPLSSLTKQFLACGTFSCLMKMLHSSSILCLVLLFPEPNI